MKIVFALCLIILNLPGAISYKNDTKRILEQQVLTAARIALQQLPITVTSSYCLRSAGGKHDFYSEGDYWWPDPLSRDSPYIQKDGMTNPENFVAHRLAVIRFSQITAALASAYTITHDERYVEKAIRHFRAWFVDTATMMNPHLQYAQAIHGRFTGRSIGIIDGIQFMEAIQALMTMEQSKAMDSTTLNGAKRWVNKLLLWLSIHPYGKEEMNARNNHGTCWVMQVAVFARFTGDTSLMQFCRNRYKNVLLPYQMDTDGSFPLELKRTKPYGYSIFNLDAMATICQVLSVSGDNLWDYTTIGGRSIKKGIGFLYPFMENKERWPLKPDVMYWGEWPVAQSFLIFGAAAFDRRDWFNTWVKLNHAPTETEVIRNWPVRNPLIWMKDD